MAKYLITTCETYRVDTESEATSLIENAKKDNNYELKKYTSQKKNKKQKGEIIDEWILVSLTKAFTDEKDPVGTTTITYDNSEGSAF